MMFSKQLLSLIGALIISTQSITLVHAQEADSSTNFWVDSVFNSMNIRERVAQTFMVAAYSNKDQQHINEISKLVQDEKIGGLVFFQGGPVRQALLTNFYQSISKVPLFISIDAEWGLGMRLDSTVSFPRQMMLAATGDKHLLYQMGADLASQMKRMGIHINFAPVVDVNVNPLNPVIGSRSFGEVKELVTQFGLEYLKGMQDNGVLACAKHFPGHGDTDADSHFALPVIPHSQQRIDSVELFPFKELINNGISGVMVAHLKIPNLESDSTLASSISQKVVTNLLKDSLGFRGLIYTDALNMKGVADFHKPTELNFLALSAGNDVLVCPEKVKESIDYILGKIQSGELSEDEINIKCKKILSYKYKAGLFKISPVDTSNLVADLNKVETEVLRRRMIEKGVTVLKNNNILPIQRLDTLNMAYIEIGVGKGKFFKEQLEMYTKIDYFSINPESTQERFDSLAMLLDSYNLLIIGYHSTDTRPSKNFGISPQATTFLFDISFRKRVILDIFGNPFTMSKLFSLNSIPGIIVSFDNYPLTQTLSAQLIFGGIGYQGKLPVTIPNRFGLEAGEASNHRFRLKYSIPQDLGLEVAYLEKVDSIALDAIKNCYTPGMQILAAKDGVVFYNKSFGGFTYTDSIYVNQNSIYDIASITKVTATLPVVMNLYETKKLDLEKTLGDYLTLDLNSNKKSIKIKDILLHQSGLQAYIPIYLSTLSNLIPVKPISNPALTPEYPFEFSDKNYLHKEIARDPSIYQEKYSFAYPTQVAKGIYIVEGYKDSIYNIINNYALKDIGKYKYSDLGFLYLQRVAENIHTKGIDEIVEKGLYKKLGMTNTFYQPLNKVDFSRIVPTENDIVFRKQVIRGFVHDPTAAMMGGIAGHAGIFSNTNDLAKIMQMYLNKGTYGGEVFYKPETVELFTSLPKNNNGNRRGLGFDKPETQKDKQSPVCESASPKSFGHSGFTGTMVWADPEYNLIYIFLSNRVYPDASNNKLAEMNIRTKIQELFYQAVIKARKQ